MIAPGATFGSLTVAALDSTGKPVLKDLKNVDVQLELGDVTIPLLGQSLTLPALAETHFKGNVTFTNGGMQIHGNEQATLAGQTAPFLNFTF